MKLIYIVSCTTLDGESYNGAFTNEKKATKHAERLNAEHLEENGDFESTTSYEVLQFVVNGELKRNSPR
jgi:hypothetical protein